MKRSGHFSVRVGGRPSPLSVKQIEEVERAVTPFTSSLLEKVLIPTRGDLDKTSSLRPLERTNFFTNTIDAALLNGEIDVAVHSAKDLPDPIPEGLEIVAITEGVDSRDALVFQEGESFWTLPKGAIIATSSTRREALVQKLRGDFRFRDVRGTINERLDYLKKGFADGVVVALASLIRLDLLHLPYLILDGETPPLQGKLAVVARVGDEQMKDLFQPLDVR